MFSLAMSDESLSFEEALAKNELPANPKECLYDEEGNSVINTQWNDSNDDGIMTAEELS